MSEHLSPGAESSSAVTGVGLAGSNDLWLADMNYRVAVELQQNIWYTSFLCRRFMCIVTMLQHNIWLHLICLKTCVYLRLGYSVEG